MKSLIGIYFLAIISSITFAQDRGGLILSQQVSREDSTKLIKIFDNPNLMSRHNLLYRFDEVNLNPDDIILIKVPDYYADQYISSISFGHRQDEPPQKLDLNPAYTRLLILSQKKNETNKWRHWGGHYSGKYGAKFAEQRSGPEIDSLYEWPKIGHYVFRTRLKSKALIKPKLIKIQNVGNDNLLLSSVSMHTFSSSPISKNNIEDIFFSGESSFGNPYTMKGRLYDGGQRHKGKFPGAFRLSRTNGNFWSGLPAHWKMNKNRVEIPLYGGSYNNKTLTQVEVMCGDTKPDGLRNIDGGWGSLGNAKLTMKIYKSSSGETITLGKNINVPPEGVLSSSTPKNYRGIIGDRLILENRLNSSTLYIMGIRLRYE